MKFKTIRELFYFTQKERYGIIFLLALIFILLTINISLPYLYKVKSIDTSKWEEEVDQYLASQKIGVQQTQEKELVQFNPNNVSSEELESMGVPGRVASNWFRYIEKGGRFRRKEDVTKIWGMTTVLFDRLKDFILLPEVVKSNRPTVKQDPGSNKNVAERKNDVSIEKGVKEINSVELNGADSIDLEKLPGFGPVLSARIIRYRKILGGYYSITQLHEVYGLREEHFASASPYLKVDTERISRFDINFSSITELGRHPYIGFKTARKIIKLRDERGRYSSADDLAGILTSDSLKKVIPYLIFNQ